jgi:hypothetical protein
MTWKLRCEGLKEPLEVQTFVEIEGAADRAIALAQELYCHPTYVELSSGTSVMGIVVGGVRSYAMFVYNPGRGYYTRYPTRCQDEPRDAVDNPFLYMMSSSLCEADLDTTVLPHEAWEAFRLYFETGNRPETLEWGP